MDDATRKFLSACLRTTGMSAEQIELTLELVEVFVSIKPVDPVGQKEALQKVIDKLLNM